MQIALSIVAIVMSALSLGWQAAMFALAGGRVKTELLVGAMNSAGGVATVSLRNWSEEWMRRMAEQGCDQLVFAVRARNTGRMGVTVERWGIAVLDVRRASRNNGMRSPFGVVMAAFANRRKRPLAHFSPMGLAVRGPELPHRLEAGGPGAMWTVPGDDVMDLIRTTMVTFKLSDLVPIAGRVDMGNGGEYWSARNQIRM
jgi:hypothetical protein